jgi:DNA-binding transcriptional regulator YiaG
MRLHKIANDTPRRVWCGPAAVCMITGAPVSQVMRLLRAERDQSDVCRRKDGSRWPLTGVGLCDLQPVFKELGFVVRPVPDELAPAAGHWNARPTLARWLEHPARSGSATYLIKVPRHYLVIRGTRGGDNGTGGPVPLSRVPCRDRDVEEVHEVAPALAAECMAPAEVKRARAQLGLSALALAELLRLGKGGDRTVRRWEDGSSAVPGPAQVAIELLLEKQLGRQTRPRLG